MGLIGAAFGLGFIVGPGLGGLLTREDMGRLGYQLPIFVAAGLCVPGRHRHRRAAEGEPREGRSRRAAPEIPRRGA